MTFDTDALVRKALESIARNSDVDGLRKQSRNAAGKSPAVRSAVFDRIVHLSAIATAPDALPGSIEHECWSMIHAVEQIRRERAGKSKPMNRLRPKIAREGVVAALEYLALNRSAGFDEVIAYGRPGWTAEAIVLRHPRNFSPLTLDRAATRLRRAGIEASKVAGEASVTSSD